ncbi:MAG TPA: hypothetical protein VL051_05290 [Burkholderiaceae bacterium]|nr:hypothetical protein [Burkholderiaceae bacterium]
MKWSDNISTFNSFDANEAAWMGEWRVARRAALSPSAPGGIRGSALDSGMPLTSGQAEAGFERKSNKKSGFRKNISCKNRVF